MKLAIVATLALALLSGCSGPPGPSSPPVVAGSGSPAASGSGQPSAGHTTSISAPPTGTVPAVPGTPAAPTPTSSLPESVPSTAPPEPTPDARCGVRQADADALTGVFDRVVNAVGRPDQGDYTDALVTATRRLEGRAVGCAAQEKGQRLVELSVAIDRAAARGEADLDSINLYRQVGNDWIEAMGLQATLLS